MDKTNSLKYFIVIIALLVFISITTSNIYAKYPKRIIALSPHSVEMLFAIGAADLIVGTVEYADYPKAALKIPRIGSYTGIQIERVIELQPDLIIVWKQGTKKADIEKLQSLDMKMFFSQPKKLQQIGEEIISLGKITGFEQNARLVAKKLQQQYQSIKQQYKNKSLVRVFYQLWHKPLRSVGSGSWIDSMITDCGGQNIFHNVDSPYPVISLETIITLNPQVIIIPGHNTKTRIKTDILDNWPQIDAIHNNHISEIDGDILHRFTPRAIDGLELLCKAIDKSRK